jgi:hypothetical protein
MARGVGRFIEIDHTRANERFEVAFERRTSDWYRSEMSRPDKKTIVVLEEQWPIARIHCGSRSFWFDGVVEVLAFGKNDCHCGRNGRYVAQILARGCFLLFGLLEWSNMRCSCQVSCGVRAAESLL